MSRERSKRDDGCGGGGGGGGGDIDGIGFRIFAAFC